jgi:NAD(P)-dependent dehydrogenase (short-subunit alcohol dehydrogenase family)
LLESYEVLKDLGRKMVWNRFIGKILQDWQAGLDNFFEGDVRTGKEWLTEHKRFALREQICSSPNDKTHKGHIINISSIAEKRYTQKVMFTVPQKHAVEALTKSMKWNFCPTT